MFSNKKNINILTALLAANGIRHAVVCPGSRNAPIVHNLANCPGMKCYPVTDERSAGFYAIGVNEATSSPVVLCVTSGSALLNVAPAVSEAYYRNIPLIVVSADRPMQWIGQCDGQTIRQPNALAPNVRKSVNLPEPKSDEEEWYCNRLVNEALIESRRNGGGPVHINVPISEPLYEFTVEALPKQRNILFAAPMNEDLKLGLLAKEVIRAEKPVLVIGQLPELTAKAIAEDVAEIRKHIVVLQEKLSENGTTYAGHTDELIASVMDDEAYLPDYIVYVGGTLVSKHLKQFLRKARKAKCVLLDVHGEVRDVFMNLSWMIQTYPSPFFSVMAAVAQQAEDKQYYRLWQTAREAVAKKAASFVPAYSSLLVVKLFHEHLRAQRQHRAIFYGNSSAVRWGNMFAEDYIHVNRGVNGIEGSLSVCMGYVGAQSSEQPVYCVIGDLSFFYDQNALWNENKKAGLKILLLNNGGGGIFYQMKGPEKTSCREEFVAGKHHCSAKEICRQMGFQYAEAHNESELRQRLEALSQTDTAPMLLEVFTDPEQDAQENDRYYQLIINK